MCKVWRGCYCFDEKLCQILFKINQIQRRLWKYHDKWMIYERSCPAVKYQLDMIYIHVHLHIHAYGNEVLCNANLTCVLICSS